MLLYKDDTLKTWVDTIPSIDLIAVHYTIGEYINGQIVESSDPFDTGTQYNIQDRCLLDNEDDCNVDTSFGCSNEEASNLPICDENIIDNCCNYIELNDIYDQPMKININYSLINWRDYWLARDLIIQIFLSLLAPVLLMDWLIKFTLVLFLQIKI